jgi:diguanylate cyclase
VDPPPGPDFAGPAPIYCAFIRVPYGPGNGLRGRAARTDARERSLPMTARSDEHERTMAFAEIALGQIKALRQAAYPRNYEIWYTYATGYNPTLNQSINQALAANGSLSTIDLDQIYDTHLSPTRLTDRIDSVGAKVVDEIAQVMSMIGTAAGSANNYSESLVEVTKKLASAKDHDGLRALVEKLVVTAKEMEQTNQKLESHLNASKQEINQLQQNLDAVRTESLTDPLTSLANRKYFDQAIDKLIRDSRQNGEPLSLIMIDIDHFKKFNDVFGHLTGDQVLRLVALSVKQNVKGQDVAARYGGEEFAVILPSTALRQGLTVGDHIRRAVMTKELLKRSTGEHLGRVTVSVGVASFVSAESAQSLIERADSCLYAAKRAGRNRVICEADPEFASVAEPQVA